MLAPPFRREPHRISEGRATGQVRPGEVGGLPAEHAASLDIPILQRKGLV